MSDILSLIHRIHAATGKDELWDDVMTDISKLIPSTIVSLARHQFSTGFGHGVYTSEGGRELIHQYNEHYSVRNPWFLSSEHYLKGNIIAGSDILNSSNLKSTDFYTQFLKPNNLFFRLCGVISRTEDTIYYVTLLRDRASGDFDENEKTVLATVLKHLMVSLHNHWQLLTANDMAGVFKSAISRFSHAILVVDREGEVLYQNSFAAELFDRFDVLRVVKNRLCAVRSVENRALHQAIRDSADLPDENNYEIDKMITMKSQQCERPFLINIHPLGQIFSVKKSETVPVVILSVRDPNKPHHPKSCSFSALYDLTPAQTRLSSLLFSGYTLSDAAKSLNVSENTLRSHLKQIYQKTSTHGQMELVHLHAKICTDHV